MRFIAFVALVLLFGAAVASIAVDSVETAKARAEARLSAVDAL